MSTAPPCGAIPFGAPIACFEPTPVGSVLGELYVKLSGFVFPVTLYYHTKSALSTIMTTL